MENYVIFANKQFNDWKELEHRLDVLFAGKKHYCAIYAYNNDDQKKLWKMLEKYHYYYGVPLIDLLTYYNEVEVDKIVIFKSKETGTLNKFLKFIKPMRIKPIIYNYVKEEYVPWKLLKMELEKKLKQEKN